MLLANMFVLVKVCVKELDACRVNAENMLDDVCDTNIYKITWLTTD